MAEEVYQAMHAAGADDDCARDRADRRRARVLRRRRHHGFQVGQPAPADRQAAEELRFQPSPRLPEPRRLLSFDPEANRRHAERRDRRPGSRACVVLRRAFRRGRRDAHDGVCPHRSRVRVRHGVDTESRRRPRERAGPAALGAQDQGSRGNAPRSREPGVPGGASLPMQRMRMPARLRTLSRRARRASSSNSSGICRSSRCTRRSLPTATK